MLKHAWLIFQIAVAIATVVVVAAFHDQARWLAIPYLLLAIAFMWLLVRGRK